MHVFPSFEETSVDAIVERLRERTQDDAEAGFNNLGSGNNVLSSPTATTTALSINAQGGNDTIQLFGTGNDKVFGGSGDDFIFSGKGNDTLFGDSGKDKLFGFDGDDMISGGSADDQLEGGIGFDQLHGGTGNDTLFGGAGLDVLFGGFGDDKLFGDHDGSIEQGRDTLSGGSGRDELHGGGSADTLFGGKGSDSFVYETVKDLGIGHTDVIMDFSRLGNDGGPGDKIDLRGIDASSIAGNQAFDLVNGPSTLAGKMWLGAVANGQQKVFLNVDGGSADAELIVRFDTAEISSLSASDFFL